MENTPDNKPASAPIAPAPVPVEEMVSAAGVGSSKVKEHGTKTMAIIGLVTVLGFLSYGIVKITPGVIRSLGSAAVSLSSLFVPAPKLSVTSDSYAVTPGQQFTLSWSWSDSGAAEQGSYTVSYPCINGVYLAAVAAHPDGTTGTDIVYCNTAYHFLNTANSIAFTAHIASNVTAPNVDIPITVHFTKNDSSAESAEVTTTVTVSNGGAVSVTSSPAGATSGSTAASTNTSGSTATAPVSTTPSAGASSLSTYSMGGSTATPNNPNGVIDLTARVLQTGIISTTTGAFIPKTPIAPGDRPAVQFEIVNQGTRTSGAFEFALVLPTFPAYTFQSTSQQPLAPGDAIQYTIAFDNIKQQAENDFTINVDNTDSVNEQNKANNIVTGQIYMSI